MIIFTYVNIDIRTKGAYVISYAKCSFANDNCTEERRKGEFPLQENEDIQMIFQSFREVNQAFHQSMTQTTQRLGITAIQYFVLKIVSENPGIGLNELSDKIFSVTSTASGIVDRMVRAGWLSRERPPTNRRSISLTLTSEGRDLAGRVKALRQSQLTAIISQISPEDVAELQRIHKQIVNIIQRQREEENHEYK